jgi:fumarylacetoacetate (FAA) hydrolase family protein
MFTGYGTAPKKFKVRYKSESVIANVTLDNLLSKVLQEQGKRNKWTQAKIEFTVDNHNGDILDKLKASERKCERCMKDVVARNVTWLPDGTIAHYYECG